MHKKQSDDGGFTIGELSRRTGVNVETIRYYERIRLMARPPRTRGGHRSYGIDGLQTLVFIRRARELSFGLDDIRALLALRAPRGCCSDVKGIAERHLDAVRAKMRDLMELEKVLAALIARCPGDQTAECPVLDVLEIGSSDEPRVSLKRPISSPLASPGTAAPALPSIARDRP